MARVDSEAELAALAAMPLAQLRSKWTEVTARPVPRVSAELLRLALAWEIQAKEHGGLARTVRQQLTQIAAGKTATRQVQPGTQLVREWNGTLHIVTVGDDGVLLWNDRNWRSLSEVARAITGTRWSGPAFFGLKQARKVA